MPTRTVLTNTEDKPVPFAVAGNGDENLLGMVTVGTNKPVVLANSQPITAGTSTIAAAGVLAGYYVLSVVAATWDGATVSLDALAPDYITWLPVSGVSFTANGTALVKVGANASLRLSAATGDPTAVYGVLS